VVGLLVLICAVMTFLAPSFLTYGNWYNLAQQMVFVALLAIGMTIVLITGGIDLSVGSVLGLSAGVMAYLVNQGMMFGLCLLLAVAAGAALGLVNGLVVTKLGIPDFVATLAMLGVAGGLLYLWTGGVPFTGFMIPVYDTLGGVTPLVGDLTAPILAMAVIAVVVASSCAARASDGTRTGSAATARPRGCPAWTWAGCGSPPTSSAAPSPPARACCWPGAPRPSRRPSASATRSRPSPRPSSAVPRWPVAGAGSSAPCSAR
jgi:ABC-type xylose transport system permease subunit